MRLDVGAGGVAGVGGWLGGGVGGGGRSDGVLWRTNAGDGNNKATPSTPTPSTATVATT